MNSNKRLFSLSKNLAFLVALLSLAGCTKKFDEINTNPNAISTIETAQIPFLFTKAESAAPNDQASYQVAQNLFSDQYAQYFACNATYFPSDRLVIRMD